MAQQGTVPASPSDIEMMRQGLSAYLILFIMGMLCTFINFPLIYVLLRSPKLRADSKLLATLAFGDMINCMALSTTGLYRYHLYLVALETGLVPLETTQTCAMKPHMWLRVIGNVWPPTVTLLMGIERTLACWTPVFYFQHMRKKAVVANAITLSVIMIFLIIAVALIFSKGNTTYVKFDCGRKATFSAFYGTLLYCYEILGYMVGLVLNLAAYLRTRSIIQSESVYDQVKRLRYYVAVSVISTLLVAVPDIKQLFLGVLKEAGLDEWISQAFNWLCLIASSLNLFVYIALSQEFRIEFLKYLYVVLLGTVLLFILPAYRSASRKGDHRSASATIRFLQCSFTASQFCEAVRYVNELVLEDIFHAGRIDGVA